MIVIYI